MLKLCLVLHCSVNWIDLYSAELITLTISLEHIILVLLTPQFHFNLLKSGREQQEQKEYS